MQLLQYCYFTMLWINGLTVVLLVQGRGEMAVLPAVTAVLLHHSAMDIWTDCSVVNTGYWVNGVSACGYCSTVTSLHNDLSSSLYHNMNSVSSSIHHNFDLIQYIYILNVMPSILSVMLLRINFNFHFVFSHNFVALYIIQHKSCFQEIFNIFVMICDHIRPQLMSTTCNCLILWNDELIIVKVPKRFTNNLNKKVLCSAENLYIYYFFLVITLSIAIYNATPLIHINTILHPVSQNILFAPF
jgi:hypothetical protein